MRSQLGPDSRHKCRLYARTEALGTPPAKCVRERTLHQGEVRYEGRILTRTGTRPPHPLHASPCPYSEGSGQCPLLPIVKVHKNQAQLHPYGRGDTL